MEKERDKQKSEYKLKEIEIREKNRDIDKLNQQKKQIEDEI